MERALLNSEEEYLYLCTKEKIGAIPRKWGSTQYAHIGGGVECKFSSTYIEPYGYEEILIVRTKPEQYPCLLVWDREGGDRDCVIGEFIYEKDFK